MGNEIVLTRAVIDGLDVTVLKYFGEAFGQEHSNVGVGRIIPQGYQDSGAILSCLSYGASNGVTFAQGRLSSEAMLTDDTLLKRATRSICKKNIFIFSL